MPTVRHGEVAGRHPEVAVDALDGRPHVAVVVGERLAHAHEHDVGHPPIDARARRRAHHLLDDLADGEVPLEAGLAGGAEAARHGAAGLAADAHRRAVAVVHEHRLDAAAVVELPQELHRVAARRSPTRSPGRSAGGSASASSARSALGRSVRSSGSAEPGRTGRSTPGRRGSAAGGVRHASPSASDSYWAMRSRQTSSEAVQNAGSVTSSPNIAPSASAESMPARDSAST
jgi:hypothetical protein